MDLTSKESQKFGIELHKTVEQALALEVLPDGKSVPIGHQFVQCHMVFDVKMEDFRQMARLVAGDHLTRAPTTIMYASVVCRKMV